MLRVDAIALVLILLCQGCLLSVGQKVGSWACKDGYWLVNRGMRTRVRIEYLQFILSDLLYCSVYIPASASAFASFQAQWCYEIPVQMLVEG